MLLIYTGIREFQSTHPVGGGTDYRGRGAVPAHISIHPPRGGWDGVTVRLSRADLISIHPPRGGWDPKVAGQGVSRGDFNPPTPWGVGRVDALRPGDTSEFQSTHPVGGGTCKMAGITVWTIFQSTHPVGGGTSGWKAISAFMSISIHPPRGGWDRQAAVCVLCADDFNPPTPWGVGPWQQRPRPYGYKFQSTHPVGGGTESLVQPQGSSHISIHPPRGGWDNGHDPVFR